MKSCETSLCLQNKGENVISVKENGNVIQNELKLPEKTLINTAIDLVIASTENLIQIETVSNKVLKAVKETTATLKLLYI